MSKVMHDPSVPPPMYTAGPQYGYGQHGQPGSYGVPFTGQPGVPGAQPGYGQPGQQGAYGVPATDQPGHHAIYGVPLTGQPGGAGELGRNEPPVVWMPMPVGGGGCPPGLEYLTQVDQIFVKQHINLFEVLSQWEQKNKYRVMNTLGQQVYYAKEESGACLRQLCTANRSFTMHIKDNTDKEVIRLRRDFRCLQYSCWCACMNCCAHLISVEAPVGVTVGFVKQKCSIFPPKFGILNALGQEVLTIEGPCCILPCTDNDFQVLSARNREEVGRVTKEWSGLAREVFTHADNFGISFPMDLDVKMKATMLGACFLIDFMFFEKSSGECHF